MLLVRTRLPAQSSIGQQPEGSVPFGNRRAGTLSDEEYLVNLYVNLTNETESRARWVFMFVCQAWEDFVAAPSR